MQHQMGSNNCGLFAIATETAICNEIEPNQLQYIKQILYYRFEQHLKESLNSRNLFPALKVTATDPIITLVEYIILYCGQKPMMECAYCTY